MNDLMKHRGEFARAIANNKYEITDAGVLFPLQAAFVGGVFDAEQRRWEPSERRKLLRKASKLPLIGRQFRNMRLRGGDVISRGIGANIVTTEGQNHILDVILHASTQVTTWYTSLFEGNYTPVLGTTVAGYPAAATECTAYDEAARVAYVEAAASGGVTTNSASRAEFTMNATKTIYGAALHSLSTKSATTGTLLAAARFSASRSVVDDDVLAVAYTITVTSS